MSAARQLIVCCDGTNNNLTGGRADTNVVKMLQWLGPSQDQVVFYDPGVGNPGELPGATPWDGFARKRDRILALALGRGVYENIAEGYQFLMANYRPDDEIYFFGFSRGAFTARSIAGLVNMVGILPPHMQSLVPTLLHVYFSSRKGSREAEVKAIAAEIRDNFCREAQRRPPVHFVGVWDTVASVGMWPFAARMTAKPTIKGKAFVHVRQALALDEHRVPFKPRLYLDNPADIGPGQSVVQRWFRGAHCDTGGGYLPQNSVISNEALAWMLVEAAACGLRLDPAKVNPVTRQAMLEALKPGLMGHPPTIHSETYDNHLWAVAGLNVRDTNHVQTDGEPTETVTATAHESVSTPVSFPQNTVWRDARPATERVGVAVLALLAIVLVIGLGTLLKLSSASNVSDLVGGALAANSEFQRWQLFWWSEPVHDVRAHIPLFHRPGWAIFADFFFITCYATILAWFVAPAFARIARFNLPNDPPRKALCVLGRALPVLVFADIAENLLTWATLWTAPRWGLYPTFVVGVLMSVASAIKWVGAAGVVALLGWSVFTRK